MQRTERKTKSVGGLKGWDEEVREFKGEVGPIHLKDEDQGQDAFPIESQIRLLSTLNPVGQTNEEKW